MLSVWDQGFFYCILILLREVPLYMFLVLNITNFYSAISENISSHYKFQLYSILWLVSTLSLLVIMSPVTCDYANGKTIVSIQDQTNVTTCQVIVDRVI